MTLTATTLPVRIFPASNGISGHYLYKVLLTPQREGGYTVTCADVPACVTEGATVREAIDQAADALATCLGALIADRQPLPLATDYEIPRTSLSAWVSFETDDGYIQGDCMSSAEAADKLGVTRGRVSQLIKAGDLDARRMGPYVFVSRDSVERRRPAV